MRQARSKLSGSFDHFEKFCFQLQKRDVDLAVGHQEISPDLRIKLRLAATPLEMTIAASAFAPKVRSPPLICSTCSGSGTSAAPSKSDWWDRVFVLIFIFIIMYFDDPVAEKRWMNKGTASLKTGDRVVITPAFTASFPT